MLSPQQQAQQIITRWRRVFFGLYMVFVLSAMLLLFLSVLKVQLGDYAPPIRGKQIDPGARNIKQLRDCHRRLSGLLTSLHHEAFSILARTQRFQIEPATEWGNWSKDWRHRWKVLEYRCRLRELAGTGVSPEIDRMADIHSALDELQISYTGVVNNFAERYADRLRKLRQDVAQIGTMIERRRGRERNTPGATQ